MADYCLLPWNEALTAHRTAWQAIGADRGLNLSLLPDWTEVVVECLTDPAAVRVVTESDGSALTGLVPVHVRPGRISGIPIRILEPISGVVGYHAELVSRDSPTDLLRALVKTHDELGWDLMRLAGIPVGSPTETAILEVARTNSLTLIRWPGRRSPYFPMGMTGEKLMASRDKRHRYQMRKHVKDFARTDGSAMRWYGKDADTGELLAAMLHVEAGSWKQAAGVAISGNPKETAYYRQLLPWLAASDHLLANVATIHGEAVAYCLCYEWQGNYGNVKGSYRQEFARLAVGHLASDELILRAADAGGLEFDFLGDADPYKLAWSPTTREHSDYFLYSPRGKGRWLGLAQRVRDRLRPRHKNQESS